MPVTVNVAADDHNRRCHPLNIPRQWIDLKERGIKLLDFENNVIACRIIHRIIRATKHSFIKRSLTETRSFEFLTLESLCRIYFAILNFFRTLRFPDFFLFLLSFRSCVSYVRIP